MFNKIVNINHIITKFAAVVLYICMIMCTNGPNLQKLHQKVEWTQVRGPENVFKRSMRRTHIQTPIRFRWV